MNEHETKFHMDIPGLCVKELILPADYLGVKETHDYTHASYCRSGAGYLIKEGKFEEDGTLIVEGETIQFKAGDMLVVEKGVAHAIVTTEPTVWYCIQGDK